MVPLSKSGVRKHRGVRIPPSPATLLSLNGPWVALSPALLAHAPLGALAPVLGSAFQDRPSTRDVAQPTSAPNGYRLPLGEVA